MTLDDISRILARLETTDLTECTIEHGAQTLRVKFDRATDSISDTYRHEHESVGVPVEAETVVVRAPAIGTFRHSHPLAVIEHPVQSAVRCGQHLGYMEIDSVLCAIPAPKDGMLMANLLQEGERVGYGQPVLELCINRLEPLPNGNA